MDPVVQRRRFDNPSKKRADRARSDPVSRGCLVPAGLLRLYRAASLQKIVENRPERTRERPPPVLQKHYPRESHNLERQETARCAFDGRRTHGWTVPRTN